MRCNSAISHLNNLANFFSKIRQSATSATIFRFQVSKAVLKGVCGDGGLHMNIVARAEYIKSPKDDAEKLAAYLQFFQTHTSLAAKLNQNTSRNVRSHQNELLILFLQKHMFSLKPLLYQIKMIRFYIASWQACIIT